MPNEIWKDVVGYEGRYMVSSLGNVKSIIFNRELILSPANNGNGYLHVLLSDGTKRAHHKPHRLVAIAFIPNIENKKTVNHKNSIRNDNRLENLERATHSENEKHGYRCNGRLNPMLGKFGKYHNRSKLYIKNSL